MDAITVGGRIRVETRRLPHHVLFELAHDGVHRTGESLEHLFLPFASNGPGAPRPAGGGGIGIAPRIIQDHGGELRIRAEGEWTTIIGFSLPIVGNQDRRRNPRDRRLHDRRRGPEAA